MNPKTVLHVIASMDPKMGGVCTAVRLMIGGLDSVGITNEVVSLDSPDASYLCTDSFPIYALGPGKTAWCYGQKLLPWFKKNLGRFDVVLIHGLWLYPGSAVTCAISLLRSKRSKTPKVFVMPHGMLDPYFQNTPGRKFKAIRNRICWKFIEHKVINNADGLLFTCEIEKELAKITFRGYKPQGEMVVGLGIDDPPVFNHEVSSGFQNEIRPGLKESYWLYISRIHKKKGVDLLVNAYVNLKKNHANLPPLLIAGPGLETEYGKYIQHLASQTSDIHFTGMLTGNAKWRAFYGCEAFILPSHQENFGIAIVEAMACGKPVLISNQINIWKEIENSGAGIISDDTQQQTEEMLTLWTTLSTDDKYKMGVRAKSCYKNYFSLQAATERLHAAICN